jgi:hypothetical protein
VGQRLPTGLRFGEAGFLFRSVGDVIADVDEGDALSPVWQRCRILKFPRPTFVSHQVDRSSPTWARGASRRREQVGHRISVLTTAMTVTAVVFWHAAAREVARAFAFER